MTVEENWVNVFFTDRDYLSFPVTLVFMSEQLPEDDFKRWHRSHIIHLKEIRYYWYCGRAIVLQMSNGQRARISKDNIPKFIALINNLENINWCESEYYVPPA